MLTDPRDPGSYRIAIAGVALALIVVLAGLCTVVALGKEVPKELMSIASALGGGLLGILVPSPGPSAAASAPAASGFFASVWRLARIVVSDLWNNRAVVILLAVFILAITHANGTSKELQALAAASGATLVGLLAPSPGTKQQPGQPG